MKIEMIEFYLTENNPQTGVLMLKQTKKLEIRNQKCSHFTEATQRVNDSTGHFYSLRKIADLGKKLHKKIPRTSFLSFEPILPVEPLSPLSFFVFSLGKRV